MIVRVRACSMTIIVVSSHAARSKNSFSAPVSLFKKSRRFPAPDAWPANLQIAAVRLDDGEEQWSFRIDEKLGARMPRFGYTTSPLVAGKLSNLVPATSGTGRGRGAIPIDLEIGGVGGYQLGACQVRP